MKKSEWKKAWLSICRLQFQQPDAHFVMRLGLNKERYKKPHTFSFQSIVFLDTNIRKQNSFVLRHPVGLRKPETYSVFYVYTCPIYFIAPSCLGKTCDQDINRILKQFHFFVSVGLENVTSVFTESMSNSKSQCKWILQLFQKLYVRSSIYH